MDLLDPSSNYNRLWIDYIAEFGEDDDAVVVVEGSSRDEVVRVLADLSKELLQDTRSFARCFTKSICRSFVPKDFTTSILRT